MNACACRPSPDGALFLFQHETQRQIAQERDACRGGGRRCSGACFRSRLYAGLGFADPPIAVFPDEGSQSVPAVDAVCTVFAGVALLALFARRLHAQRGPAFPLVIRDLPFVAFGIEAELRRGCGGRRIRILCPYGVDCRGADGLKAVWNQDAAVKRRIAIFIQNSAVWRCRTYRLKPPLPDLPENSVLPIQVQKSGKTLTPNAKIFKKI